MSTQDDDVEFCREALADARKRLSDLRDMRLLRGVPGGDLEDVTEEHRCVEETHISYWIERLAALGVNDV